MLISPITCILKNRFFTRQIYKFRVKINKQFDISKILVETALDKRKQLMSVMLLSGGKI